jgi:hypothetical protein
MKEFEDKSYNDESEVMDELADALVEASDEVRALWCHLQFGRCDLFPPLSNPD